MNSFQLTSHFSIREAIFSDTAIERQIFNFPVTDKEIRNIEQTALKMEDVRAALDSKPITVTSWFRNVATNRAIGSRDTSDHIQGNAVDFKCHGFGTPVAICKRLIENADKLKFKQLILEYSWVHIAWDHDNITSPKLQVLTLLKDNKYATGLTDLYGKAV